MFGVALMDPIKFMLLFVGDVSNARWCLDESFICSSSKEGKAGLLVKTNIEPYVIIHGCGFKVEPRLCGRTWVVER